MRPRLSLPARLGGPLPALPGPLDALSERWSALRPRVRALLALGLVAAAIAVGEARITAAQSRWGGGGVEVLVASRHLSVGAVPEVETVTYPPRAVPPNAAAEVGDGATLALALPEGAVLTDAHLDPAGPAAGLDADLRVVPIPVEPGWGIAAGASVDVWGLGVDDQPARAIARDRPILELSGQGTGKQTALVGLDVDDVAAVTEAIALGRVLLAHSPGT